MAKPLGEKFRKGGRNAAFFPQLSGLARGLDKVIAEAPSTATGKGDRSQDDIDERKAKQAAKLARRAKQHGHRH